MDFYHGVKTKELKTVLPYADVVENGITFAVGTAPVHTVGGGTNRIVMIEEYEEAIKKLGYSSDWDKYSLCEVMYTHFGLYSVGPVIFVNVLDPEKHRKKAEGKSYDIAVDGTAELSADLIADTVIVKSAEEGDTYTLDTDYTLSYGNGALIMEKTENSGISGTSVYIEGYEVDPSMVKASDIIGGVDVNSGNKSGLELVDGCLTAVGIVPEFIVCPGYSQNVEVARAMNLKAAAINQMFKGKAIIDLDCDKKAVAEVIKEKEDKKLFSSNEILCYPAAVLEGVKYHLSTHIAALMSYVDKNDGGIPSNSPSNKELKIDGIVLKDGTEINLELSEANKLDSKGIVTALNFIGGWKSWGNYTACKTVTKDPKDYYISVNRMFGFVAKTLIYKFWGQIDAKMTPRLVETITDSVNIWLNGLTADGHLLGGRAEYIASENSLADLMEGKIKFHIYLTPPSPAVEIEFDLEYDTAYIAELFGA